MYYQTCKLLTLTLSAWMWHRQAVYCLSICLRPHWRVYLNVCVSVCLSVSRCVMLCLWMILIDGLCVCILRISVHFRQLLVNIIYFTSPFLARISGRSIQMCNAHFKNVIPKISRTIFSKCMPDLIYKATTYAMLLKNYRSTSLIYSWRCWNISQM